MEQGMTTRYLLSDCAAPGLFERRKQPRWMVFNVAAEVRAKELAAPLACTVRDVSDSGARLEIDRHNGRSAQPEAALPELVDIYFSTEARLMRCRIAWQDGRHFGVEFIAPASGGTNAAPSEAG
jgi:hypothetical protein